MGFFSWLSRLFRKKEETIEPYREKPVEVKQEEFEKDIARAGRLKPKYRGVPRTKEMREYVGSIVKKAQTPDLKPTPIKGDIDQKKATDYVDKIQGRKG